LFGDVTLAEIIKKSSKAVPAPYKFSRPLGGGGPRIKATWPSDTKSNRPSSHLPNNLSQSATNIAGNQAPQAIVINGFQHLDSLKEALSQAIVDALKQQGLVQPVHSFQPRSRLSKVVKVPVRRTKDPLRAEYAVINQSHPEVLNADMDTSH